MRKLKLDIETITVQTLDTTHADSGAGTVVANEASAFPNGVNAAPNASRYETTIYICCA